MIRHKIALLLVLTTLPAAPVLAQSGSAPSAVLNTPQSIAFGAPLTLSGAQSFDTDGNIIRYVWTKIAGTGGGMALNQSFGTLEATYLVPQPAGQPLAVGRHRFRLVVDDNSGNHSTPNEREVIVVDNIPPTAVLEGPKQAMQVQPFQLSGMRSSDTGGKVVRFLWTRVAGTSDGPMPLGQPVVTGANILTVAQSLTSYLGVGRHLFRLVVLDDAGNQSKPADFPVEITAPLPSGRSQ